MKSSKAELKTENNADNRKYEFNEISTYCNDKSIRNDNLIQKITTFIEIGVKNQDKSNSKNAKNNSVDKIKQLRIEYELLKCITKSSYPLALESKIISDTNIFKWLLMLMTYFYNHKPKTALPEITKCDSIKQQESNTQTNAPQSSSNSPKAPKAPSNSPNAPPQQAPKQAPAAPPTPAAPPPLTTPPTPQSAKGTTASPQSSVSYQTFSLIFDKYIKVAYTKTLPDIYDTKHHEQDDLAIAFDAKNKVIKNSNPPPDPSNPPQPTPPPAKSQSDGGGKPPEPEEVNYCFIYVDLKWPDKWGLYSSVKLDNFINV